MTRNPPSRNWEFQRPPRVRAQTGPGFSPRPNPRGCSLPTSQLGRRPADRWAGRDGESGLGSIRHQTESGGTWCQCGGEPHSPETGDCLGRSSSPSRRYQLSGLGGHPPSAFGGRNSAITASDPCMLPGGCSEAGAPIPAFQSTVRWL